MIKSIKYGCGEKLIYADSDIGKKNFKYVRIGIDKVDKIYKIFADANFKLIPSGHGEIIDYARGYLFLLSPLYKF